LAWFGSLMRGRMKAGELKLVVHGRREGVALVMALLASDQALACNLLPHDEPGEVGGAAMATIPRTRRQHFQTPRDDFTWQCLRRSARAFAAIQVIRNSTANVPPLGSSLSAWRTWASASLNGGFITIERQPDSEDIDKKSTPVTISSAASAR
jgi:hypothetical protein